MDSSGTTKKPEEACTGAEMDASGLTPEKGQFETRGASENKTRGASGIETRGASDIETRGASENETRGASGEETRGASGEEKRGALSSRGRVDTTSPTYQERLGIARTVSAS